MRRAKNQIPISCVAAPLTSLITDTDSRAISRKTRIDATDAKWTTALKMELAAIFPAKDQVVFLRAVNGLRSLSAQNTK